MTVIAESIIVWVRHMGERVRAPFIMLAMALTLWSAGPAQASGSGTAGDPFTSLSDAHSVSSGRYYFNTGSGLYQADVDNSEGGGWMLVLQYVHQGGTNPPLSILAAGSDMPVTSSAALGTDESGIASQWGHAGNAAMSQFTGDIEMRWYAETGAHSRIMHFSTTLGDDYVRTGLGNFSGIDTNFTALTGHSANLPASANNLYSGQGDEALTNFPFFRGATYHWAVRGLDSRWEVDDFANGAGEDTIHRIWVRQKTGTTIVTNTTDSGVGSLRDAINTANSDPAKDTISFDIPGAGPHTITLTSGLPSLTDAGITIDGSTQSGASCGDLWGGTPPVLQVRLDVGATITNGISLNAANTTVRGLSLSGFIRGVRVQSGSDGSAIECNYIGLAPDGTAARVTWGVYLEDGSDTVIGGLGAGDGNVIGSNTWGILTLSSATNTTIQGNFIGTDPTGTAARRNTGGGIGNTSGLSTINEIRANLISGNTNGITFQADDLWSGVGGADLVIAGNYIGTDRTGNAALPNVIDGIDFAVGTVIDLVIGGTNIADRNVISGNGNYGINLGNQNDVEILGNYIGTNASGTAALANGIRGINVQGGSDLIIGGTSAAARNIISGNSDQGIMLDGASDVTILGNYIGTNAAGTAAIGNYSNGIVGNDVTNLTIGTTAAGNVMVNSRTCCSTIWFTGTTNGTIVNNLMGTSADGSSLLGSLYSAFHAQSSGAVQVGDGTAAGANVIANGTQAGITISGSATGTVAILANEIRDNIGIGIDVNSNGVTLNDSGDGDTGPNDLLNFPVINSFTGDGTTAVSFDINLDVPSNASGYRIDFFKNTAADSSGYGEGETHLGSVDVNHTGGNLQFTSSFTANAAVSTGDIISATATRKTSGVTYDITSEFSLSVAAIAPADPLIVTSTADTNTLGTLRYAITHANLVAGDDAITFDIAGTGPHTIALGSALPTITDDGISIDGSTQSGASCGTATNAVGALTDRSLQIVIDGNTTIYDAFTVQGSNTSFRGLSIVDADRGIYISGGMGTTVTCSHVGVMPDGITAAGNDTYGIIALGTDNVAIGGTAVGDRVLVGDNGFTDVMVRNGSANFTMLNTWIGVDATGLSAFSAPRGFKEESVNSGTRIGDGTAAGRVILAGHSTVSVTIEGDTILNGIYVGVGSDGTTALGNNIGLFSYATSGLIQNSLIAHSTRDGIYVDSGNLAMIGNSIHNNSHSGIDIAPNDINTNDSGDGDTGPNDLLNFPVINSFTGDGTTAASFDINLDVPSNASGYRIDFFKNTAANSSGYGEGETHLGSVDVNHTGGNLQFISSFTANAAVSTGDIISATATRKTSGVTYDITSEFSLSVAAIAPADPLIVTSTADTNTLGTLRYAITHANANPSADVITFNIPTSDPNHSGGVWTISPTAALTLSDDGIVLDASSQPGATCGSSVDGNGVLTDRNLAIEIDASNTSTDAINIDAANVTIKGFAIGLTTSFFSNAIDFETGASGTVICNHLGTTADGLTARAIEGFGIETGFTGNVADSVHIGDGTYAGRNVIANTRRAEVQCQDNGVTCTIRGNYIGVFADGFTPGTGISNNTVWIGGHNSVVGGPTAAERNVIGLSIDRGIGFSNNPSGVVVENNYIGVAADGQTILDATLSGGIDGIDDSDTAQSFSNLTIRNNVIGGFPQYGVDFQDSTLSTATIAGNHIGVGADGVTDTGIGIVGIILGATTHSALTIGGAGSGNVIGFMSSQGIYMNGTAGGTIIGNFIGVGADGTTNVGNGSNGIRGASITSVQIGNGAASSGNVIAGNAGDGIYLTESTNVSILGNHVGVTSSGNAALPNSSSGMSIHNSNTIAIGGSTAGSGNVVSGNVGGSGVFIHGTSSGVTVAGNQIGVGADGSTALGNAHSGIWISSTATATIGGTTAGSANILAHNAGDGITVAGSAKAAILRNIIRSNGDIGIDLNSGSVTANDSGDGDTGPNDLLNFPVVNQFTADGSLVVGYDISLDTPANGNGYRIEFFKNSISETYGQGEEYLGFIDVAGPGAYTGSFTAQAPVSVGEYISTTTTRKTGGSTHDITSEFSLTYTAFTANPADLAATKSVAVVDDGLIDGDDTVAIPGATLRYTITIRNDGAGAADVGTTILVDDLPPNGSLVISNFDGVSPGPVGFNDGSPASGLSYTFSGLASGTDDLEFSDDNGVTWTYTPIDSGDGTDPNVTHIRLKPDGAFNPSAGTPPSAAFAYDVVLF